MFFRKGKLYSTSFLISSNLLLILSVPPYERRHSAPQRARITSETNDDLFPVQKIIPYTAKNTM